MTHAFLRHALRWLWVALWLLVIYYFSSQPDLKSGFAPTWDWVARKIAHVAEYFILTYLLVRAVEGHGVSRRAAVLAAVACAFGAAGFDEWHQTGVAGRSGSVKDVLIDGVGIVSYGVVAARKRV